MVLEGRHYAVPVAGVREVLRLGKLTEVPRGPPTLAGLIDVRGDLVPVFDIRKRLRAFGCSAPVCDWKPSARVVRMREVAGGAGIIADAVQGVVPLALAEAVSSSSVRENRPCVAGVICRLGIEYALLDVEQAVSG